MASKLAKDKLIYEAIFEFDKLALAKEKDRLRNLRIQKCPLIPKDLKGKLQIKSDRIQKLLTMYLKDTALTSEDRELIMQACSVYNCEIYHLLKTVHKCFLLRRIYWNFIKDSKEIFVALGDGSAWSFFMLDNHEIIVPICLTLMTSVSALLIFCAVLEPVIWTAAIPFVLLTLKVFHSLRKHIKEKDLYGMVERVSSYSSHLDRKRRNEVKGLSAEGIDVFKKITEFGKFT